MIKENASLEEKLSTAYLRMIVSINPSIKKVVTVDEFKASTTLNKITLPSLEAIKATKYCSGISDENDKEAAATAVQMRLFVHEALHCAFTDEEEWDNLVAKHKDKYGVKRMHYILNVLEDFRIEGLAETLWNYKIINLYTNGQFILSQADVCNIDKNESLEKNIIKFLLWARNVKGFFIDNKVSEFICFGNDTVSDISEFVANYRYRIYTYSEEDGCIVNHTLTDMFNDFEKYLDDIKEEDSDNNDESNSSEANNSGGSNDDNSNDQTDSSSNNDNSGSSDKKGEDMSCKDILARGSSLLDESLSLDKKEIELDEDYVNQIEDYVNQIEEYFDSFSESLVSKDVPFMYNSRFADKKLHRCVLSILEKLKDKEDLKEYKASGKFNAKKYSRSLSGRTSLNFFERKKRFNEEEKALEAVIALDISGSMKGKALNNASQLAEALATGLEYYKVPTTKFAFDDKVYPLKKSTDFLRLYDHGGTNIANALHNMLDVTLQDNCNRLFIIITDGEDGDLSKTVESLFLGSKKWNTVLLAPFIGTPCGLHSKTFGNASYCSTDIQELTIETMKRLKKFFKK